MKTNLTIKLPSFILLAIFAGYQGRAQSRRGRERYFNFGINWGCMGGATSNLLQATDSTRLTRSMGIIGSDNGRGRPVINATGSLGLSAGVLWKDRNSPNFTAFQLEFQQNRNTYYFDHPYLKTIPAGPSDNDSDDGPQPNAFVENDVYLKYSASLQRFWYRNNQYAKSNSDKYWYIKESFGQTFLHRNNGSRIELNKETSYTDKQNNTIVSKIIAFNPTSYMLGTEIGLRNLSKKRDHSFDIGIAFYMPFSPTYTQQYEFYRNDRDLGTTKIAFNGASIFLNMTYTFNKLIPVKPEHKHPKKTNPTNEPVYANEDSKKTKEDKELTVSSPVKKTEEIKDPVQQPEKKSDPAPVKPLSFADRKTEVQKTIIVHTPELVTKFWDNGIVDGDSITVYLNDKEILSNYMVVKHKKDVILHLKVGENFLVVHALNLGSIPPNTAAVLIEEGGKKRDMTVVSDMKKSGVIKIIYKPGEQ